MPRPPEALRQQRDADAADLRQRAAAERVVLERVLARIAEVDRRAHAIPQERPAAMRREAAEIVGTDDRVATGGAAVAGREAAEVADVETRIPVQVTRIGGQMAILQPIGQGSIAPATDERPVLFSAA